MLGSGTQTDPYLISTPADVDAIRNNLSAYYQLTNDIDMSSWGNFVPIGKASPYFTGVIDGKGYKISNLSIADNSEYTAFIGRTDATSNSNNAISNLGLENIYVESNSRHLAGLIGLNYKATISNCYVTGTIKNTVSTSAYIGGIIGRNYGTVQNCYTQCSVTGGSYLGGFVGMFADSSSIVKNNYSKSIVSGTTNIGGFYGDTNTNTGYKPTYQNNFFDKDIAGTTNYTTTGVSAKTTAEMKTQSTYTGWDFTTVWSINNDYPTLRVFNHAAPPKIETINVNSHVHFIDSGLNKFGKVSKVTESFLKPISNELIRKSRTERNVSTYLSPIVANVQKSNRTVRNSTQNVHSFIRPISSSIYKESKTIKNLLAYIKPIQARIDVLYPLNINIPTAYVSTQENDSNTYKMENMSETSYIINPSYVEEVK